MAIVSSKLYQNKNGYASTDTGYYSKTTVFSNANGWSVIAKVRDEDSPNDLVAGTLHIGVADGVKTVSVNIETYFIKVSSTNTIIYQSDFNLLEHVITLTGKGSDYYVFVDGRLVVDGTGLLIAANASNVLNIGDNNAVAGSNASGVWSYLKYVQGTVLAPIASSGSILHEFACWSGYKTALLAGAYNAGLPISIKTFVGNGSNYVGDSNSFVRKDSLYGITQNPTVTTATPILLSEMELFQIGSQFKLHVDSTFHNNTATSGSSILGTIDGSIFGVGGNFGISAVASAQLQVGHDLDNKRNLGLHRVSGTFAIVNSGTVTAFTSLRRLISESYIN